MNKRLVPILLTTVTIILIATSIWVYKYILPNTSKDDIGNTILKPLNKGLKVPDESSKEDKNNNGIADPIDICNNLNLQLDNKIKYVDAYYSGGYPPDDLGVCTDVIWRAFNSIDVNFKDLIDNDIAQNLNDYPRVNGQIDTNIDFRRVPNLKVYFEKYATIETTEIKPGDADNLKQWQPGDIILYLKPYEHVGIVSS
ncbi:MAG: DUF1287 domain-containing protein, partial [Clostridium sp.]